MATRIDKRPIMAALLEFATLGAAYVRTDAQNASPKTLAADEKALLAVLDALARHQQELPVGVSKRRVLRLKDLHLVPAQKATASILERLSKQTLSPKEAAEGIAEALRKVGIAVTAEQVLAKASLVRGGEQPEQFGPRWIASRKGPRQAAMYLVGDLALRGGRYGYDAESTLDNSPLGVPEAVAVARGGVGVGSVGVVRFVLTALGFPDHRVDAALRVLFSTDEAGS